MFNEIFENVNKFNDYGSMRDRIKQMLESTWTVISVDTCVSVLKRMNESVNPHDIARVDLHAEEVRSAVYENVCIWEHELADVYEEWESLSVQEQDKFLMEVFPNGKVYGV